MENPIKMDDLGGTIIFGNPHMNVNLQIENVLEISMIFRIGSLSNFGQFLCQGTGDGTNLPMTKPRKNT